MCIINNEIGSVHIKFMTSVRKSFRFLIYIILWIKAYNVYTDTCIREKKSFGKNDQKS